MVCFGEGNLPFGSCWMVLIGFFGRAGGFIGVSTMCIDSWKELD